MKKLVTALAVVALGIAPVAGCANPDKSRDDARDTLNVDHTPPKVIQFNNHFPNVEFKCNAGTGVYVETHKSSKGFNTQIIPNDPACRIPHETR